MGSCRVGVLVLAYEASSTLERLFTRIPLNLGAELTAVLICDDGSKDDTFCVAARIKQQHPHIPIELIRRPVNLGYGGNQKAGYRWMIDHGLDLVVLLHGDGQYAPECLPQMIEPILDGRADVVLGSRMLVPGAAIAGGMPLYKYVGNKILTYIQNEIVDVQLSEWHSGYRSYSVPALAKVKFDSNSDYYDFDTQIILQLIDANQKIVEIPVPTFYGDTISRVNGVKYAYRILGHVIRWKLSHCSFR